jgi:hypothetical protein
MPAKVKKFHSAVKHAGFCSTGLLPGEDRDAFERLNEALIEEFRPDGPLENDIVATIARLTWRKQNLHTFRLAAAVQQKYEAIRSENIPAAILRVELLSYDIPPDRAKLEAGEKAADAQAQKELGHTYALATMGEEATIPRMLHYFEVEERLDSMIDKCLKRLLFLRGLKSMRPAELTTPAALIAGPGKAA